MNKAKSTIIKSLMAVALMFAGVFATLPTTVSAAECDENDYSLSGGANCAKGDDMVEKLWGEGGSVTNIINIVLFVLAAVAVIILIYGGVQYVLSTGDSSKVASAKNTILYAVIGLVIAILAYAVVNFVIGAIVDGGETDSTASPSSSVTTPGATVAPTGSDGCPAGQSMLNGQCVTMTNV